MGNPNFFLKVNAIMKDKIIIYEYVNNEYLIYNQ